MAALFLSFFGSFQAIHNDRAIPGFRTSKAQALLIYLATEQSGDHRREVVMELMWPGMPERSARHNLRQVIYHLRSAFPGITIPSPDGS